MAGLKLSTRKKIYRFAVYGRAASGKTCILAALAMKCISNTQGYTCTWVLDPPDLKRPHGKPESWDPSTRASQFFLGREWLEKAIALLYKGKLPPPNPNRAEPLRHLFHFTTPAHRTFQIELIDYSGELIDPAISGDEMAQHLHEHINDMDGILVLAEAPHPNLNPTPLANEMLKLEQAFVMLKGRNPQGPTLNFPVALLINKWDRVSKIDPDDSEKELAKLNEFLASKPEPPHNSLVNTLRNSVSKKNFRVFPVSAFGCHELISPPDSPELTTERPCQVNPLQSFGLEDGFIWASKRRDEIDIQRFSTEVTRRASFCIWKTRSIFPPFHLARHGQMLAARFPSGSEARKRVHHLVKKISVAATMQTVCNTILTLLVLLFAEILHDGFSYRSVVAIEGDPQASSIQLKEHEDWLERYYKSPEYLHLGSSLFVLNRRQALKTLKDFRHRRDEMLWMPVNQTSNELSRITLARKYLEQFGENGRYRDQAAALITQAETKKRYLQNEIFLASISASIDALLIKNEYTEADLDEIQAHLEALPEPKALNDELFQQQRWLLDQLVREKIKLAKDQGEASWIKFREAYYALMRDRKTNEAAAQLASWQTRSSAPDNLGQFNSLVDDFKKRITALITGEVAENIKSHQWRKARNVVSQTIEDQQLVAMLSAAQLKELQKIFANIDRQEDVYLYELATRYKDRDHLNQYLKNAPLKKMQRTVLNYESYLNRIANPIAIKLHLAAITWGEFCNNAHVTITLDGKSIIEKDKLRARHLGRSAQIGYAKFAGKLTDPTKLHADVTCNGFWGMSKMGEASWQGQTKDLNGLRLGMGSDQSDQNYMTFSLSGIPLEPSMPTWGK